MLGDLVAMFICGFLCAVAIMMIMILAIFFKDDDKDYPTDEDMDQMCLWYEEEYKNE